MSLLLFTLQGLGGCLDPKGGEDGEPEQRVPAPIGEELMSFVAGTGPCGQGHLYRKERAIQSLCFDQHGEFSYENRGTLTVEAAEVLDQELAAADLSATEPVNYMGSCGVADAFGTQTLWVGDQSVTFETSCPIEGVLGLYEQVLAIRNELGRCGDDGPELLESIEPGCRSI